jgi:DNA-binding MarR family transcriptional regulator
MDPKAIKELEILHEVSESEHINQRYLSKKLGMASGLVNLYLKRLAHKGYIKVSGIKPRRLTYLLTPKGIAEKSRLTYEFALISYKYFKHASDEIRRKLEALEKAGQLNVVVYGTGEMAEMCLVLLQEFDLKVVAVVDDEVESTRFCGFPVAPKELLHSLRFDQIIVAKIGARREVEALARELGVEGERLCWVVEA